MIAVPTSIGYGASFGGIAALLTMLNSCANGVTVVNIDNSYGAGFAAATINRIADGDKDRFFMLRIGKDAIFFLLLFSLILTNRISACPFELPITTVSVNGHNLYVEWAATPSARSCGLSRRPALKKDWGMLFVYTETKPLVFWMKETWIPLSIAFLDASGKIINIETMTSNQTEKRYRSNKPALYALEANQGWFQENGIKAGDQVRIKHVSGTI